MVLGGSGHPVGELDKGLLKAIEGEPLHSPAVREPLEPVGLTMAR